MIIIHPVLLAFLEVTNDGFAQPQSKQNKLKNKNKYFFSKHNAI